MTKKGEYIGTTASGDAFDMASGRIGKTVCAAVKFSTDGRIVQRGKSYWQGEEPKSLATTASRMAAKWQAYYKRTGKRAEVERDKANAKKEAARKVLRDRDIRTRTHAPKLAELLGKIVGHYDVEALLAQPSTNTKLVDAARAARELLEFIQTGKAA